MADVARSRHTNYGGPVKAPAVRRNLSPINEPAIRTMFVRQWSVPGDFWSRGYSHLTPAFASTAGSASSGALPPPASALERKEPSMVKATSWLSDRGYHHQSSPAPYEDDVSQQARKLPSVLRPRLGGAWRPSRAEHGHKSQYVPTVPLCPVKEKKGTARASEDELQQRVCRIQDIFTKRSLQQHPKELAPIPPRLKARLDELAKPKGHPTAAWEFDAPHMDLPPELKPRRGAPRRRAKEQKEAMIRLSSSKSNKEDGSGGSYAKKSGVSTKKPPEKDSFYDDLAKIDALIARQPEEVEPPKDQHMDENYDSDNDFCDENDDSNRVLAEADSLQRRLAAQANSTGTPSSKDMPQNNSHGDAANKDDYDSEEVDDDFKDDQKNFSKEDDNDDYSESDAGAKGNVDRKSSKNSDDDFESESEADDYDDDAELDAGAKGDVDRKSSKNSYDSSDKRDVDRKSSKNSYHSFDSAKSEDDRSASPSNASAAKERPSQQATYQHDRSASPSNASAGEERPSQQATQHQDDGSASPSNASAAADKPSQPAATNREQDDNDDDFEDDDVEAASAAEEKPLQPAATNREQDDDDFEDDRKEAASAAEEKPSQTAATNREQDDDQFEDDEKEVASAAEEKPSQPAATNREQDDYDFEDDEKEAASAAEEKPSPPAATDRGQDYYQFEDDEKEAASAAEEKPSQPAAIDRGQDDDDDFEDDEIKAEAADKAPPSEGGASNSQKELSEREIDHFAQQPSSAMANEPEGLASTGSDDDDEFEDIVNSDLEKLFDHNVLQASKMLAWKFFDDNGIDSVKSLKDVEMESDLIDVLSLKPGPTELLRKRLDAWPNVD